MRSPLIHLGNPKTVTTLPTQILFRNSFVEPEDRDDIVYKDSGHFDSRMSCEKNKQFVLVTRGP